jgi:hypothetical protein
MAGSERLSRFPYGDLVAVVPDVVHIAGPQSMINDFTQANGEKLPTRRAGNRP